MSAGILLFVFVLNFAISWFNCWSCGRYWTESKQIGGGFRLMTWLGVIMGWCGFTWCALVVIVLGGMATDVLNQATAEAAFSLGYLILVIPILGSGLGITLQSWANAYRNRNFGSTAIAGYNTVAQMHNMYSVARNAPSMFENVVDALLSSKGSKSKNSASAALMILVVVLAISASTLLTMWIVQKADASVAEEFLG